MESNIKTDAVAEKDRYIAELEARLHQQPRISELLIDAEQRLAAVPELQLRIADLESEVAAARGEADAARRELWELDQMLMYSRRALVYVRPLIEPLRKARKRLRS